MAGPDEHADVRVRYRDGFTTYAVPAVSIAVAVVGTAGGAWWVVPFSIVFAVAGWSSAAQRLQVTDGVVFVSHLPGGSRGTHVALDAVRFRHDAVWLHVERLDGERISRRRREVVVRVFPIGGPPVVVHELRAAGIHVVSDTAAPW